MEDRHRCARCGEMIGVYEPRVVVGECGGRTSSLELELEPEPALAHEQSRRYHLDCYAAESCALVAAAPLAGRTLTL